MSGPTAGDLGSLAFLAHTILKNDQSCRDVAPLLRLLLIGQNMLSLEDVRHDIIWPLHFVDMAIGDVFFKERAADHTRARRSTDPEENRTVALGLDRWSALQTRKHDSMDAARSM
ncbi:unnamed protein product [Heligmosomoides polygyrus]|uniref:Uncharacterized protein n=1 Tax=Heligmosomoides polygyrus TaxID=6339 RepID=A0A183G6T1_HELPZ|nr:unnamed protein product [Heligmosomoides polygyrus]